MDTKQATVTVSERFQLEFEAPPDSGPSDLFRLVAEVLKDYEHQGKLRIEGIHPFAPRQDINHIALSLVLRRT